MHDRTTSPGPWGFILGPFPTLKVPDPAALSHRPHLPCRRGRNNPGRLGLCLHSVALPLPLPKMFSEEVESKQQLAQQREAVSSRGMCGGNWELGITCPEMGGLCLHRRPPNTV